MQKNNTAEVVTMTLFGAKFTEVESHLFENLKKTKAIFPEETQILEHGLALMWNLTQVTYDAMKDFRTKPNFYANTNLFGRNRQLLFNAYFCMLCSNYGTQFVLLRTVLENNNLMRLFNINPKYAFEWLPKEKQKRFSLETQLKYDGSIEKKPFNPFCVMKDVLGEIKQKKVKENIAKLYGQLCNYTHPNFLGWQELMATQGENEILLPLPVFMDVNTEIVMGMTLYLTQLSFKTFVETFKDYTVGFDTQLAEWQSGFNKLIIKFVPKETRSD